MQDSISDMFSIAITLILLVAILTGVFAAMVIVTGAFDQTKEHLDTYSYQTTTDRFEEYAKGITVPGAKVREILTASEWSAMGIRIAYTDSLGTAQDYWLNYAVTGNFADTQSAFTIEPPGTPRDNSIHPAVRNAIPSGTRFSSTGLYDGVGTLIAIWFREV